MKGVHCFIVVPGTSDKFRTGGLMVIKRVGMMLALAGAQVSFICTHEEVEESTTIKEAAEIAKKNPAKTLFIVTWGPLVESHISQIQDSVEDAKIVYYAQSFGWGIRVPRDIPIVCVSRYILAQWTLADPFHPYRFIPPALESVFAPGTDTRDIEVLVHERKQNKYALNELIPALEKSGVKVERITKWIAQPEFASLLGRSKIFLYCTHSHKGGFFQKPVGEGFGLPALESVASGTVVASNLLGGVTDFLTPGKNSIALSQNTEADVNAIHSALQNSELQNSTLAGAQLMKIAYDGDMIMREWEMVVDKILD